MINLNIETNNKIQTGTFLNTKNNKEIHHENINDTNDNVVFKIIDDIGEDKTFTEDKHININNIKNIVG